MNFTFLTYKYACKYYYMYKKFEKCYESKSNQNQFMIPKNYNIHDEFDGFMRYLNFYDRNIPMSFKQENFFEYLKPDLKKNKSCPSDIYTYYSGEYEKLEKYARDYKNLQTQLDECERAFFKFKYEHAEIIYYLKNYNLSYITNNFKNFEEIQYHLVESFSILNDYLIYVI